MISIHLQLPPSTLGINNMNTCFVLLSVVSVVCSMPYSGLFPAGSPSSASGRAAGTLARGSNAGPHQESHISQLGSTVGGSATGDGESRNHASALDRSSNDYHGPQHTSSTNAISNQRTFDNLGFEGFNQDLQGFNQGLQGLNQDLQGFNQGFQGLNQGVQGFNQGFQGLNQGFNPTFNHGLNSGVNPAFGRDFNYGLNQGFRGSNFNNFNQVPVRQQLGGFGVSRHPTEY